MLYDPPLLSDRRRERERGGRCAEEQIKQTLFFFSFCARPVRKW